MAGATIWAIFSLSGDRFTSVQFMLCFPAYTYTFICMKLLHTKNMLCTFLSDHLSFEETRKREQLVLTGMAYPGFSRT